MDWRGVPTWQKALVIGGGAAAAAGLVWFLVREGEDDEDEADEGMPGNGPMQELPPGVFFKVMDPRGANVGLRTRPDTSEDARCADSRVLKSGDKFEVSHVVDREDGQTFLRLADGRGWAFTKSSKDGRTLCQPAPSEPTAEERAEEIAGLYPPGDYRLINESYITNESSMDSADVGELQPGASVKVLEVITLVEEQRVRGRIAEPAGWISLLKLDDGYRWVVPAKLPSMANLPPGSQQAMMFDQLKKMFLERPEVLEQCCTQAKAIPQFAERLEADEDPCEVAAEFQMMMMMSMAGPGGPRQG